MDTQANSVDKYVELSQDGYPVNCSLRPTSNYGPAREREKAVLLILANMVCYLV